MSNTNFTKSETQHLDKDVSVIMDAMGDGIKVMNAMAMVTAIEAHVSSPEAIDPANKQQIAAISAAIMAPPDATLQKAMDEVVTEQAAYTKGNPAREARVNAAVADMGAILSNHGFDTSAYQLAPDGKDHNHSTAKSPSSAQSSVTASAQPDRPR